MRAAAVMLVSVLTASSVVQAQPAPLPDDASQAAASDASGQMSLGSYERQALDQALTRLGLTIEPDPAGKVVGRIHVVNLPVFGPGSGFLRWFNIFHRTSRVHVVEREVLLRPGQLWDEETVDETRRRLRDPLFTTLAVVVPVRSVSGAPGQVDLLVVTQDIWSLRMNSRYELQESTLSQLSLSLSENNLLGLHKQIALVFDMDLGSFTIGPQYVDKNIGGSRLRLVTKVDAVFNRETQEAEGSQSVTSFSYPLWSLDTPWGGGIVARHFDAIRRSFQGPELRTYDNPDTPDIEEVPFKYRERFADFETSAVRQLGDDVKHRITFGHLLTIHRPSVTDDFAFDETTRDAFVRDVLPRSERSSALFARYSFFTPTYRTYRDIDSFDLAEDQRIGPEVVAEVGSAMEVIGSEANFMTGSLVTAWTFDLAGDGVARISAGGSTRLQDSDFIDNTLTSTLSGASPSFFGMRLAARATWARRYDETNNRFYTVGGDSGLRGYSIADFAGQIRVLGNLELRTLPVRVLFTRFGGVLFYDVGHAADCYSGCDNRLVLHQDVGAGARFLVPQLQPFVFRVDWAIPLTGVTAGFPGRIIAGVQQAF